VTPAAQRWVTATRPQHAARAGNEVTVVVDPHADVAEEGQQSPMLTSTASRIRLSSYRPKRVAGEARPSQDQPGGEPVRHIDTITHPDPEDMSGDLP
jgi:hypothetical protein